MVQCNSDYAVSVLLESVKCFGTYAEACVVCIANESFVFIFVFMLFRRAKNTSAYIVHSCDVIDY